MEQFNVYTKTYGNGMKEVYLPLYPVNHMALPSNYQLEAFPADAEALKKAEERKALKNAHDCLNRARKTVYSVAVCNDWDYFITLTLAENRTDVIKAYEEVRGRLKYLKYLYPKFHYLIVSEAHKKVEADGRRAIHFHGLISGLPSTELGSLVRMRNGKSRDIKRFRDLGYSVALEVDDRERVAKYITKYITKDLIHLGMHKSSYIVSRGLRRPESHRYTIRADHVDYFRRLLYMHQAQVFEAAFGSKFTFPDLDLDDKQMFDQMFVLCDFFDDDP